MTLIELLAAVTITVIVVSSISTLFPKASSAIAANRQRLVATQLAQALVQQAKRSPYALLDPTAETAGPAADFPTNGTGTGPGKCDCNTANFFVLAGSATVVVNNIAYSQSTCVNYFEPINLQTYCPSALGTANLPADPGLKTVHVRVWWSVSASTITIDMASKVARL